MPNIIYLVFKVPMNQIIDELKIAESKGNRSRIESIVCGTISRLSDNKLNIPDPYVSSLLCLWTCEKAEIFLNFDSVLDALCSLLRKPNSSFVKVSAGLTVKVQPFICTIACNALLSILEVREKWPDSIVKV